VRTPPLVRRALELAATVGFDRSCAPEDGALLHVLAGRRGLLRAAEIGTGAGVGAAWIVSVLAPGTPFVSVEDDPERAAAAAALFEQDGDVRILAGDWRDLLPAEAPFDLLFVASRDAKDDVDAVVGLMMPGGTAYVDDFTCAAELPDPRRDAWLRHDALAAAEIPVTPARRAIVAVRI
jgi:predicted O-methyltransferase YrrM